ncbi:ATP-binding cassette domain-containing protein [Roseibium sp.]|uniref:ATP-binding cassette domain-containing protein n=1 Tax=Roseibium sp. TaxID=1936156 RepID=UPI003A969386
MADHPLSSSGLTLDQVEIDLGTRRLVTLDRRIGPGEVLTVMGDSGSGKSSLLDFIAGFLDPAFRARGRIWLDGTEITSLPPQERKVGLMFQAPLLFPHMSVGENLLFGLDRIKDQGREQRRVLAEDALSDVGLAGFFGRDPATLSGGQQTRIALMRLLLAEPGALLLDEPFSSLDQSRRSDLRNLVFSKAREKGLPVLLVTHDPDDADAAGGDVIRL